MATIPAEKIDEIRSAINIVHYISQFVNLKKAGKTFKGLCPFHHEKTPSFIVNPEKQFYHCFGCGRGGNLYTFITEYEKMTFPEAVQKAADFAGIALPKITPRSEAEENTFHKLLDISEMACQFFEKQLQLDENKRQLNYFTSRQITAKTIRLFRLGYAPESYDKLLNLLKDKNLTFAEAEALGLLQKRESGGGHYDKFRHRIIFPFFNVSGKIVGFGGRKLRDEQQPKYLNSPESAIYKKGQILYGLHHAIQSIRDNDFTILVEGYFDLLRLIENGIRNVVASSGTALTDAQARLVHRYSGNVYLAYDGDEAGIKAAIRNARILENEDLTCYIVPMPAGEDPDTYILKYGKEEFRKLQDKKVLPIEFQLNAFFENNPTPSMEEKDVYVKESLEALADFKNTVKAGLYIHHLSDRLQINESMLVNELNRIRRRIKRRSTFSGRQETLLAEKKEYPFPPKLMRGAYKAEEGIIELLLNGDDEVTNYLIEHVTMDMFENDIYNRIFSMIIHEIEEYGKIDLHRLYDSHNITPDVLEMITKLTVEENFAKNLRFASDCIYQLRKWRLQKLAMDISNHLKTESESPEALMHYTRELSDIRKQLALLEKEHQETAHPNKYI